MASSMSVRLGLCIAALAGPAHTVTHPSVLEEGLTCDQSVHLLQARARAEPRRSAAVHAAAAGPFVLDVSAPRSGTQSFYTALKMLGLNPLHTGYDRAVRPVWYDFAFGNGTFEAALATLKGYDAAMDEPTHLLYKDFMREFPEAKFVLHPVHREPQDWYRSMLKLMTNAWCFNASLVEGLDDYVPSGEVFDGPVIDPEAKPVMRTLLTNPGVYDWDSFRYWGCHFNHRIQTRAEVHHCLDMYMAHEQAVRREIPADKLLVFDMKEGWGPLCKFLGLPEPEEPFPHVDDFDEPTEACKQWHGHRGGDDGGD